MRQVLTRLAKFMTAFLGGIAIGLCFLAFRHLAEDTPSPDLYYAKRLTSLGVSAGVAVGLFWATAGLGEQRFGVIAICWAAIGATMFLLIIVLTMMQFVELATEPLLQLATEPGWFAYSLLSGFGNGHVFVTLRLLIATLVQSIAYGACGVFVSPLLDQVVRDMLRRNRGKIGSETKKDS